MPLKVNIKCICKYKHNITKVVYSIEIANTSPDGWQCSQLTECPNVTNGNEMSGELVVLTCNNVSLPKWFQDNNFSPLIPIPLSLAGIIDC